MVGILEITASFELNFFCALSRPKIKIQRKKHFNRANKLVEGVEFNLAA